MSVGGVALLDVAELSLLFARLLDEANGRFDELCAEALVLDWLDIVLTVTLELDALVLDSPVFGLGVSDELPPQPVIMPMYIKARNRTRNVMVASWFFHCSSEANESYASFLSGVWSILRAAKILTKGA